MSLNNKNKNNIKALFHSKSQNKYDLNNVELSLTNSIDNSDFVLLKNGTIKKKRKKNSYFEGYLENKRLNKAMENSNIKRVKSYSIKRNKKNIFFKSNNEHSNNIKKIVHSDNNIFSKAQKINIFENVIINNINNNNLKLSYSFNNENSKNKEKNICNCDKYNDKSKCKYSQMIEKKQKKLDKYENLIKTKNMYKDLWKNLKNKTTKKSFKKKNKSNKTKYNLKEFSPENTNFQKENLNQNILYNNNNLKIIKNDIVQYNPFFERKRDTNKIEINKKTNKNLMLDLKNLIVFKKQKDYKHYDNIGNNYNFYERNESESERKKIKNNNISENINILNKIKNEKNKSNIRNIYDKNYGNVPEIIDNNNNEYGNHHVYISSNTNYFKNFNNKSKSNINHKLTNINMNKVSFKNIENITDTIKKNYSILKTNNFNNIKTYVSNSNKKNIKEKEIGKMKNNKSNINLNNISNNYFNTNNGRNLLDKNMKKNKSYSNYNKYNILIDKNTSADGNNVNKSQIKILNNLKKYETKMVKTYFDYGNNLENYNNTNRKEIKYCNTDRSKNNKMSNYNYYNSSQHIHNYNYNLRDKFKEETKNNNINGYIYKDNNKGFIHNKKEEKGNINIQYGINKEKQKNKILNYHSSRKNHNYYECKSVKTNRMKNSSEIKLNNNQVICSYNKKNNNIMIKSVNIKDEIKMNLNERFQNINNNLTNFGYNSARKYNCMSQNQNTTKNKKIYNNIKVTSISNIPKNKNISNNSNKVNEELNKLKIILKIKKRKSHSYSPNKKLKKNYFIYGKNNKVILDMKLITNNINYPLNYSHSTKILKKIIKGKNDIIKMTKLKKNLTEKNIIKIPFNNIKKKKILTKNKSFDLIMPPNKLDEIYTKNHKL